MRKALRLALVQLASGPDVEDNLGRIRALTGGLSGVDLAILPECAICRGAPQVLGDIAQSAEQWIPRLAPVAEQLGAPVVFGGVPVADQGGLPRKIFNSSLVLSPDGELLARYDKMHLFQLSEDQHTVIDESDVYTPGCVPTMFEVGEWEIGLSICYDLRFPELYRQYVPAGLMVCTAAFTQLTGAAHWKVLLRARAIENQCYMIGVGQCGEHPSDDYRNYGHTLCVDPWGRVIAEAGEEPVCLVVDIDFDEVAATRRRIPALCGLKIVDA